MIGPINPLTPSPAVPLAPFAVQPIAPTTQTQADPDPDGGERPRPPIYGRNGLLTSQTLGMKVDKRA